MLQRSKGYYADAFRLHYPLLGNLARSCDLAHDKVVHQSYENFVTLVASVPKCACTVKMPKLTVGEYFRLDPRHQAMYRDWLAERHTNPLFTPEYESGLSSWPPTVTKLTTKSVPGPDPQELAAQRDRVISEAQLSAIKRQLANVWNIVSNTEQALNLDKKLGTSNLRRTDQRALEQRTRDLVALQFNSMRELKELNGYLRAY